MFLVMLAIMLPFLIALFIPLLAKRFTKLHVGWFVLFVPVILFIYFVSFVPQVAKGNVFLHTLKWIPSFDIQITTYIDGLGLLFGLLITGVGSLVVLYSIYYLSRSESLGHFYVYLLMFMGAMLGVVFTDHMLILYVFWEITSVASFLLIAFWYERKRSRYGAMKSMLITVFGGIAMLIGFLFLYKMTGTFSIRETIGLAHNLHGESLFVPALVLVLLGAFTKSAQFPFHIWLPDAMEAPTPVSAYLHSATMVKAGIYLVARFTPVFGGEATWFWLVSIVGLITLFWGSFNAVKQVDLKALLAYSTISQLGLVMSLLGIGSIALIQDANANTVIFTQAMFAALFHLVNHSTFKGALFMVVGIIDLGVGTRDVRRLGGLASFMPITFTIATIGSFSMAGLPPFNGFLSKEMFFEAVLHVKELNLFALESWGSLFPVLAWIASVFTFVYCLIIVFQTFFGPYQQERLEHEAKEAPFGMLISPLILAIGIVFIFFFPNMIGKNILYPAMLSVYPQLPTADLAYSIHAWHGFNPAVKMTLGVIVLGVILYKTVKYWRVVYRVVPSSWTIDGIFQFILRSLDRISARVTHVYMTGNTRDYLIYIYLFFVTLVGGALIYFRAFDFNMANDAPVGIYEIILTLVMLTAGVAIAFSNSRLVAIILNGVLGYSIALFFVLFRAPDLALTQLVVETVTTALFLLCFYYLPDINNEKKTKRLEISKVLISLIVGIVYIAVALSVKSGVTFTSIASYFENAYELTGGKNIVNSILGDFRAFDTMLEVVVLLIAGLGVYTLVMLRMRKGE